MPRIIPLKEYNILFWNCHGSDAYDDCHFNELNSTQKKEKQKKKQIHENFTKCICDLIENKKIHILCLAECKSQDKYFESKLQEEHPDFYCYAESKYLNSVGKIRVYTNLPKSSFKKKKSSDRFLTIGFLKKFDLCFVHLKSNIGTTLASKQEEDQSVYKEINYRNTQNKFLIGDFNLNPYSENLLNSNLFNTIRYGEEDFDLDSYRKHPTKKLPIYINPCWKLLGSGKIHGTTSSSIKDFCHLGLYLFDQVIFAKELKNFFKYDSLEIISSVQNHSLINDKGCIQENLYSDHLPIYFSLQGVI